MARSDVRLRRAAHTSTLIAALAVVAVACSPIGLINRFSSSDHYETVTGLAYGDLERQVLNVYTPRERLEPSPLIVFFYGGGWKDGEKEDYGFVASSLTEAGYVVVIPDYRLFPEVVFPAFVEDGALAVAWALRHAEKYQADSSRVFLMGHSAGAHIAALLCTDTRYLRSHGIEPGAILGFVGLSGPYDFLPIESGYLLDVFPEASRAASQPVNFVTDAVPPTLLVHGADDDVVQPRNSESLAERLSQNGVPVTLKLYEGEGHAEIVAALAPPLEFTAGTLEDSLQFLDQLSQRTRTAR